MSKEKIFSKKNKSAAELLVSVAEENRTRMILSILKESYDLDDALKRIEAILFA